MHAVIAPAIEELCAAFERHDYNPTPVIDIGVLVANADGTVDEQERALLSDVFQTLLETNLTPELVDALIRASAEVIQAAGAEPRARLVGAILHDCDAAEPGLRVALAIAFSSEGLSADERSIIDKIADAADVSQEHLAELVKEVEKHSEKGDPVSTRMSLLPEHLRSQ
ncbi:MAG: TerB family tellurite resistance protein [Myxococcales bacterium]|nr:TerB family tellurite resistance protein [Myxococcales bacterium]MCB9583475.1 TerB family tellurite resistance protein [Polyangiaceae bacterium]